METGITYKAPLSAISNENSVVPTFTDVMQGSQLASTTTQASTTSVKKEVEKTPPQNSEEEKKKVVVVTEAQRPVPVPNTTSKVKWGVFTGSNITHIKDFENRVSENPDYLAYFVHWGNDNGRLPSFLKQVAYEKGRTLVLFSEASDYVIGGTNQPDYSYSEILAGRWDNYFTDFASQLEAYKGPVILIPFSELNGNWTPWSGTKNGNTPEQAVSAWRYMHGFFDEVPNVSFGFAVNSDSVPNTPENQIENYYPGDAYVDYVGVDGFNDGTPWMTFSEIFDASLSKLAVYNKPILIFSFASKEGMGKAQWLHDALFTQIPKHRLITGFVYFNQNKEHNWLLWSDTDTFKVFEDYITN